LKHGAPVAPRWVRTIEAAEAWGMAPWEIEERQGELIWYLRWCAYRDALIKVHKEQAKEYERKNRNNNRS